MTKSRANATAEAAKGDLRVGPGTEQSLRHQKHQQNKFLPLSKG